MTAVVLVAVALTALTITPAFAIRAANRDATARHRHRYRGTAMLRDTPAAARSALARVWHGRDRVDGLVYDSLVVPLLEERRVRFGERDTQPIRRAAA